MPGTKIRFQSEANRIYTYSNIDTLLENPQDILDFVEHHQTYQVPRLNELDDYYLGNNRTVFQQQRRKEEHMADHRAAHNHARYVSQFIVGYLTGNPISVTHTDEEVQKKIIEINDTNDADAINSELTLDCSIYGRAYEMVFRSQKDENRFTLLSPLETFVIYDDTVEKEPIAGVRYRAQLVDEKTVLTIEVYTNKRKIVFESSENNKGKMEIKYKNDHYFDGVPINEYQNDRFRQGDFENVLTLIDLYDAAQSDTANYMTDLNDAMLKITGNVEINPEEAKKMKESNMIFLKPSQDAEGKEGKVDAEYIYKEYDVTGVEAYKNRIEGDIHKFTNTPNMDDDNFGQEASGEAMKYKLFGLEQVRATKERFFKRSMMDRYRLINNIMANANELPKDTMDDISILFTPNLPKSTAEAVKTFNDLGGELSNETKLTLLPFVDDTQEEQAKMEKERSAQRKASSYMSGAAAGTKKDETDESTPCPRCNGDGKIRSDKTGDQIQCPRCKGTGTI